jgi:hypothetical protein
MALGASTGVGSALAHRLERPQQVGWLDWGRFWGAPRRAEGAAWRRTAWRWACDGVEGWVLWRASPFAGRRLRSEPMHTVIGVVSCCVLSRTAAGIGGTPRPCAMVCSQMHALLLLHPATHATRTETPDVTRPRAAVVNSHRLPSSQHTRRAINSCRHTRTASFPRASRSPRTPRHPRPTCDQPAATTQTHTTASRPQQHQHTLQPVGATAVHTPRRQRASCAVSTSAALQGQHKPQPSSLHPFRLAARSPSRQRATRGRGQQLSPASPSAPDIPLSCLAVAHPVTVGHPSAAGEQRVKVSALCVASRALHAACYWVAPRTAVACLRAGVQPSSPPPPGKYAPHRPQQVSLACGC